MNYKITLNYEVAATSAAEARRKALKFIAVSEALPLAVSPRAIFENLEDVRGQHKEHFIAFILNTQNEIIKREIVSIGTLNASLVHPREVFREAIKLNACSLILAHNHPSGSLEPSMEDVNTTQRLKEAGKILGIEILDHVLVTAEGYKSFREANIL